MATLDVWIAKPGLASQVDDRDWVVRIDDAQGIPYHWAGTSYAGLAAPHAHWAGSLPPGTYVVSASRPNAKPGEPAVADATIVTICCTDVGCVRLFVRTKGRGTDIPTDPKDPKDPRDPKNPDRPKKRTRR